MTDADRGFVATAAIRPLSFVEWEHASMWLVYICGFRTGTLFAGEETAFYRSIDGGEKLFSSLADAITELERISNWIIVANAEFCRRDAVYA